MPRTIGWGLLGRSPGRGVMQAEGGVFSPQDLPYTLSLWLENLDSNDLFSDDSGTTPATQTGLVGYWKDKSAAGHNVIQATAENKPQRRLLVANARPVVWFGYDFGATTFLQNATKADWKFLHNGSDYTVFLAWMTALADPNARYGLVGDNGAASASVGMHIEYNDLASAPKNDSLRHYISRGVGGSASLDNTSADNVFAAVTSGVVMVRFDAGIAGNDSQIWVNDVSKAGADPTQAYSTADPTYNLAIGTTSNNNLPLRGIVYAVLIYQGAVTAAEATKVVNYLRLAMPAVTLKSSTINEDNKYNAFPALIGSGDARQVYYRKGEIHVDKGIIARKTSTDGGATWAAEETIVSDATYDVRDPSITKLANGNYVLSYFLRQDNGTPIADAGRVAISTDGGATWGAPATLNSTFDTMGLCSPVVELNDGTLVQAFYGKQTAETRTSANLLRSADGGATWANEVEIADGNADDHNYDEPSIVKLSGSKIACLLRDSTNGNIYQSISTDNGATWGALSIVFPGDGAPHVIKTTSGIVFAVTRDYPAPYKTAYYVSVDDCATWSPLSYVNLLGNTMEYASPYEIGHKICLAYAHEDGVDATKADVFYTEYAAV